MANSCAFGTLVKFPDGRLIPSAIPEHENRQAVTIALRDHEQNLLPLLQSRCIDRLDSLPEAVVEI